MSKAAEHADRPPKPIARPEAHDKVMAIFEALPRGNVLDAQCGEGALSLRLSEAGFSVSCCDVDPGLLQAPGFEVEQVDLNSGRLGHAEGSFDYVVSVNGLHRLYNYPGALGEFSRVLKPGGRLVICIPNYSSITRRMRFLLTGGLAKNIITQAYKQTIDAPAAHFRHALTAPQLLAALSSNGFTVTEILKHRTRRSAYWLLPLTLLAKCLAPIVYRRDRELYSLRCSNSAAVLLGGHHVYVVATRNEL